MTTLLREAQGGRAEAIRRLMPLVYDELRELARIHRYRFRDPRAPGTQSLVHEAYLKLVDLSRVDWQSRGQFFAIASRAMRSILIDNARRFARGKREGERRAVPIEEAVLASEQRSDVLLALDEALDRLRETDERLAAIVECRFFGGLTVEETAEALSISPATVKRGWTLARSWLYRQMKGGAA